MKFLCDQMLIKLGRWLRIAGYDTAIVENPLSDEEILAKAIAERRTIVTRDRQFSSLKESPVPIILLKSNSVIESARELKNKCSIDWEKAPFSRCSLCNGILKKVGKEELRKIPQAVYEKQDQFWLCPTCRHIYWMGSHTDRMMKTLLSWNT